MGYTSVLKQNQIKKQKDKEFQIYERRFYSEQTPIKRNKKCRAGNRNTATEAKIEKQKKNISKELTGKRPQKGTRKCR